MTFGKATYIHIQGFFPVQSKAWACLVWGHGQAKLGRELVECQVATLLKPVARPAGVQPGLPPIRLTN